MTVKEHYNTHLGHFYSWMTGDLETKAKEFENFLIDNKIKPGANKITIDLGAGHGIQSIPLSRLGFKVIAVDFNDQLLTELKSNAKGLNIQIIQDDIRQVKSFASGAELIVCCGDTLTHLNNKEEIETLIADISSSLTEDGKVVFSFRDYSKELKGTDRFIPVKSDNTRILTCILDYEKDFVNVTDLLHEKINEGWQQKLSTYKKVRLHGDDVVNYLVKNRMTITFNQVVNRMITIIATKK